jgi:NAD-dependent SIR2 family protein deacetylase
LIGDDETTRNHEINQSHPGPGMASPLSRLVAGLRGDVGERRGGVMAILGAGISTSAKIPDFRSKTTGLYDVLASYGLVEGQEAFDVDVFCEDPSLFYSIAPLVFQSFLHPDTTPRPTIAHNFIGELYRRKALRRAYTQNIDGLEREVIPERSDKRGVIVQAHGSIATASCIRCNRQVKLHKCQPLRNAILEGRVPSCRECGGKCPKYIPPDEEEDYDDFDHGKRKRKGKGGKADPSPRNGKKQKKSDDNDDGDDDDSIDEAAPPVMKPDAVFFHQFLPDVFEDAIDLDFPSEAFGIAAQTSPHVPYPLMSSSSSASSSSASSLPFVPYNDAASAGAGAAAVPVASSIAAAAPSFKHPSILLVMGSSLKVEPVSIIPHLLPSSTTMKVLINKERLVAEPPPVATTTSLPSQSPRSTTSSRSRSPSPSARRGRRPASMKKSPSSAAAAVASSSSSSSSGSIGSGRRREGPPPPDMPSLIATSLDTVKAGGFKLLHHIAKTLLASSNVANVPPPDFSLELLGEADVITGWLMNKMKEPKPPPARRPRKASKAAKRGGRTKKNGSSSNESSGSGGEEEEEPLHFHSYGCCIKREPPPPSEGEEGSGTAPSSASASTTAIYHFRKEADCEDCKKEAQQEEGGGEGKGVGAAATAAEVLEVGEQQQQEQEEDEEDEEEEDEEDDKEEDGDEEVHEERK